MTRRTSLFWLWFLVALSLGMLGAVILATLPAEAGELYFAVETVPGTGEPITVATVTTERSGHPYDECREFKECLPKPHCVKGYDWFWYPGRRRTCAPVAADYRGLTVLCYEKPDGSQNRFKFWGMTPIEETQHVADQWNAGQCR
jgi:hypothetical protein